MKTQYDFTIQLRCPICGSTDVFINDDETYGKCNNCNKEFLRGKEELVELNQAYIQEEIDARKEEIQKNLEIELTERFKKAFKGNKYIKF